VLLHAFVADVVILVELIKEAVDCFGILSHTFVGDGILDEVVVFARSWSFSLTFNIREIGLVAESD